MAEIKVNISIITRPKAKKNMRYQNDVIKRQQKQKMFHIGQNGRIWYVEHYDKVARATLILEVPRSILIRKVLFDFQLSSYKEENKNLSA